MTIQTLDKNTTVITELWSVFRKDTYYWSKGIEHFFAIYNKEEGR
jgi:hypothetical protein